MATRIIKVSAFKVLAMAVLGALQFRIKPMELQQADILPQKADWHCIQVQEMFKLTENSELVRRVLVTNCLSVIKSSFRIQAIPLPPQME